MDFAIVVLLLLLVGIEARNMRLLYTILAEIRDVLDEQPYRKQRAEQQRSTLRARWQGKADTD